MAINNLYFECNEFRLVDVENVVLPNPDNFLVISEPDGWQQLQLIADRMIGSWGVEFKGSSEGLKFGFQCGSGGQELVQQVLDAKGGDGMLILQLYVDNVLEKEWDLDLYIKGSDEVLITVPVSERRKDDKVKSRRKTKIAMDATETIDGTPLSALTPVTITLPQKQLLFFNEEKFSQDDQISNFNSEPFGANEQGTFIYERYVQFGFDELVKDEIPTLFQLLFEFITTIPPGENFETQDGGLHTFTVQLNYEGTINNVPTAGLSIVGPVTNTFELNLRLDAVDFLISNNLVDNTNYVQNINMLVGAEIRLYAYFRTEVPYQTDPGLGGTIDTTFTFEAFEDSQWQIKQISTTDPTDATGFFIHDLCRRTAEIISDTPGIYRSDFLGNTDLEYFENGVPINYPVDGCGSKILNMNGFAIRDFTEGRPLQPFHEENLEATNALFNMGWNWEFNSFDELIFRHEPISYFFRDVEIQNPNGGLSIDFIYDGSWQVDYAIEDVTYNKITCGYKTDSLKEDDTDVNTLDDVHTQRERLPPIIKKPANQELDYQAICPFVASPYWIERKRRQQFSDESTSGDKQDDKIAMIAVERDGIGGWEVETNAPFAVVNGVLDAPEYTNLRYTPERNLRNHASFLNSGFIYKGGTEEIEFKFSEGNYEAETQFNPGEPCPNGDPNLDLINEGANIELDDFFNFESIFEPFLVTLKTRTTWDLYQSMFVAPHMNTSPNADNYGYYTARNPLTGDTWQLYLFGVVYEPKSNDIELRFIKKNPNWNG